VIKGNVASGTRYSAGLLIYGWRSDYNTIIGNHVGTDASGTKALPNETGILVGAAFNRIGGTAPGEANLISGNNNLGIVVSGGPGNVVLGNLIGTTNDGDAALGNTTGVVVGSANLGTIVESNLVSGNREGIGMGGDSDFVIGNVVGLNLNKTGSVPNNGHGVYISGEHNIFQGNLVAYSLLGGHGVVVEIWLYNTIRRNSIYSNTGQGIYLFNGGNQMLPAPVITAVTPTGISGTACPGCTVEVFSDAEDEGRFYEGSAIANAVGEFTFTKPASLTGPYVTATATDQEGNTSEFSAPQRAWARIYLPVILKGW
jgi:hypothetical protein